MDHSTILKDLDTPEAVDWHPDFNETKGTAYEFISGNCSGRFS